MANIWKCAVPRPYSYIHADARTSTPSRTYSLASLARDCSVFVYTTTDACRLLVYGFVVAAVNRQTSYRPPPLLLYPAVVPNVCSLMSRFYCLLNTAGRLGARSTLWLKQHTHTLARARGYGQKIDVFLSPAQPRPNTRVFVCKHARGLITVYLTRWTVQTIQFTCGNFTGYFSF